MPPVMLDGIEYEELSEALKLGIVDSPLSLFP
jgi:hypothetical protein